MLFLCTAESAGLQTRYGWRHCGQPCTFWRTDFLTPLSIPGLRCTNAGKLGIRTESSFETSPARRIWIRFSRPRFRAKASPVYCHRFAVGIFIEFDFASPRYIIIRDRPFGLSPGASGVERCRMAMALRVGSVLMRLDPTGRS